MTSTNTYTTKDRTPYTYFIRWNELDLNYYGRRTAKNCHPEEFFITYFTSSKYVSDIIAEHGMPDLIKIHKIFYDIDSCKIQEERFLKKVNAARSLTWLNQTNGDLRFDTTGMNFTFSAERNAKISAKLKGRKHTEEQNLAKSIRQKGRKPTEEQNRKISITMTGKHKDKQSIEKQKQTCLEKYGVDNPMQNPEIQEKHAITKRKNLLKKLGCESEQEVIEKIYYYEKLYNVKRSCYHNSKINLKKILTHFPETANKSITGLRTIYNSLEFCI